MVVKKKSIYNLNIKEMKSLIRDFSCTLYGRTVFFLAYFVPLMALLVMFGLVLSAMIMQSAELFYPIMGTFFVFIGLFILGNIYYYYEIRIFSEKR